MDKETVAELEERMRKYFDFPKDYGLEDLVDDLEVEKLDNRRRDLLTSKINNIMADPDDRKSKQELLVGAGFSKTYYKAFDEIESYTDPMVKLLAQEQLRAVQSMKEKISDSNYRDLVLAIDKLTRNMQLLMDEATERVESETKLTDEQYDRLFKLEAKRRGWRPPEEGNVTATG